MNKQPHSQTLFMVFLLLFLDILGFSILFPIVPELLDYYLTLESIERSFLPALIELLSGLSIQASGSISHVVVLFGGLLGAFYSILQFICAPFLGSLSDRYGRKNILCITTAGTCLSYAIWVFADSFPLFLLSRTLAGLMSANISIGSAVVADITTQANRAKGMAVLGISIGLGFTFGPAMGGLLSTVNLSQWIPENLLPDGLHLTPFSAIATVAFLLSLVNFLQLVFFFRETLPAEERGQREQHRTHVISKIFEELPYPGVNQANLAYFLQVLAFSGMEFTLVFLAAERFSYTARDNAWLFVTVGLLMILTQGGYVRRKTAVLGEKRMAIQGMSLQIPGLFLLAFAEKIFLLYLGVSLLAIGSAISNPTLTSLVSLYCPANDQGRIMGLFRSAGALARSIGPLICALLYWQLGSTMAYLVAALFMIVPTVLLTRLPQPKPLT